MDLHASGSSRREFISQRLQRLRHEENPETRANYALEVLDSALLGIQGPYFDFCPDDVRQLRSILQNAGLLLLDPSRADKLEELERSTTLSFPPAAEICPLLRLNRMSVQWLDELSPAILNSFASPPHQVGHFIEQLHPTAPASADFELFNPIRVTEFLKRVQERCEVPDFRVAILRADIEFPSGKIWRDHPLHAISCFTYQGNLQLGSFFGSCSGLLLRYFKHVPFEHLHSAVQSLVNPFLLKFDAESTTIGIPAPAVLDLATNTWKALDRPPSTDGLTYRTLCAKPLNFQLVTPQLFDEPAVVEGGSVAQHNHYFYRGPEHLWNDPEFVRIITNIRGVRREMRVEAREGGGFLPVEIDRDRVRKDWAREFLAQYFDVRRTPK